MAENKSKQVHRKPFAVATSKNKVVSLSTLSSFAIKSASTDSRVLDQATDEFQNIYGTDNLIEPKYNPGMLKELLEMNTYHARACKTKARDVAGGDWKVIDRTPELRKTPEGAANRSGTVNPGDAGDEGDLEDPAPSSSPVPTRRKPADSDDDDAEKLDAKELTKEHRQVTNEIEEFDTPLSETMYEFWLDVEACGFGCFEIARENNDPNGQITDLVHIEAPTIRQHRSRKRYKQQVGNKHVWYKDVSLKGELDYRNGQPLGSEKANKQGDDSEDDPGFADSWLRGLGDIDEDDYRATEVIWIEQPGGRPDIIPAIPALYGDQARTEYNISFFENYGVPSMMLLITGDYDPGEEDDAGVTEMERFLEERLSELISEPYSNLVVSIPTSSQIGQDGQPAVSIQAVPLSPQVDDAAFRLFRQDNRDEVLTANQVDPYRAQVIVQGQLGGNTASESSEIYKQSTLLPKQKSLEHRINKWIIRDKGRYPNSKLEFSRLDTRDIQRDAAVTQILFNLASITPNEIIEIFKEYFNLGGMVEHPAMDLHYLNGKPIDSDDQVTPEMEELVGKINSTLGAIAGGNPLNPNGDEGNEGNPQNGTGNPVAVGAAAPGAPDATT